MKTKAITAIGTIHVAVVGTEIYRLTHHSRPTRIVTGETALLAAVCTDPDNDGEIEVVLVAADGATFRLSRDTRHAVNGWRASRYVGNIWDEFYLFFPNLHDAIVATGKNADEAIRNARMAF